MIDLIFYYGTEIVFVRINGIDIRFATSQSGNMFASIEGLKLSKNGVMKEYPDLIENDEWKQIAIDRFKNHVHLLKDEDKIASYIIEDLKKYGYVPKFKQRAGFRREVIK